MEARRDADRVFFTPWCGETYMQRLRHADTESGSGDGQSAQRMFKTVFLFLQWCQPREFPRCTAHNASRAPRLPDCLKRSAVGLR
eukprot:6841749-Prymnesium_polylepis.1